MRFIQDVTNQLDKYMKSSNILKEAQNRSFYDIKQDAYILISYCVYKDDFWGVQTMIKPKTLRRMTEKDVKNLSTLLIKELETVYA